MYERSRDNRPIDTVLYEIDMLRHCANALPAKKSAATSVAASDTARAEYNLGIEGFLLHLRNLLDFFLSRSKMDTDLRLDKPEVWTERTVRSQLCEQFRERAEKKVNDKYRARPEKEFDCHRLISIYLQHCTTYRHQAATDWDIQGILNDFDPVLKDFEEQFAPESLKVPMLGFDNNSTTAFRQVVEFNAFRKDGKT